MTTDAEAAKRVLENLRSSLPDIVAALLINPITGECETSTLPDDGSAERLSLAALEAVRTMEWRNPGEELNPDPLTEIVTRYHGLVHVIKVLGDSSRILVILCNGGEDRLGWIRFAMTRASHEFEEAR
jgi:hypothetical protein